MNKMKKYIYFGIAALFLTSCNDFLQREPLAFGNEDSYYKSENDLKIAANNFYGLLPANNANQNTGLYSSDMVSDNQFGTGAQTLLYEGAKRTPDVSGSDWSFSSLRAINFFIQKYFQNENIITGSKTYIEHYLGEAYFFRAYDHFRLLRAYGDAPILTKMLSDNAEELIEASKRYPRNEVARFILEDLDRASELMMEAPLEKGRLTKAAAYALKSRVALYEATWEKYHANTCFVPGNSKWPGKETWPDFSFKAGSAEAEINFFLDQALDASEKAVANHPLYDDYMSLFNQVDLSGMSEVILARYYQLGVIYHNCSYFMRNGGGRGVTRQAVASYLMANGLPTYAAGSGFHGDNNSYYELMDRDPRIAGKRNADGTYPKNPSPFTNHYFRGYGIVRAAGKVMGEAGDTIFLYLPYINGSGNDRATTGYELNKWVSEAADQQMQNSSTTAVPIFRSAECMLNYLEAYYERYGNVNGGNCDQYWKAIRKRAGMDEDYNKTIQYTQMDKEAENDLGAYSRGALVDATLYNIRRERRCEFMAEGRRTEDLKRWRSFDMMRGWQPEGINFWTEVYKAFDQDPNNRTYETISPSSLSVYIRPLQGPNSVNPSTYNGYNFPKPHYLEPIPISEITLTIQPSTGKSIIYQNPGWPADVDGTCNLNYDCD